MSALLAHKMSKSARKDDMPQPVIHYRKSQARNATLSSHHGPFRESSTYTLSTTSACLSLTPALNQDDSPPTSPLRLAAVPLLPLII